MDIFSYRPKRQPKVVKKKLGREGAWGFWDVDHNLIEVDERLRGKKELIIYLHEYYHKLFPNMTEDEILVASESTADFLWRNNYRKVDLSAK